jgi:hypothetical protein
MNGKTAAFRAAQAFSLPGNLPGRLFWWRK